MYPAEWQFDSARTHLHFLSFPLFLSLGRLGLNALGGHFIFQYSAPEILIDPV